MIFRIIFILEFVRIYRDKNLVYSYLLKLFNYLRVGFGDIFDC